MASEWSAIRVRPEAAADAAAIARVHDLAFGGPDEAAIVERLRATDAWLPDLSLVAEVSGVVVGHVVVSLATLVALGDGAGTPAGSGVPILALGPIGVLPAFQHRGVGDALMRAVIGAARTRTEPVLVLLGRSGPLCRRVRPPLSRRGRYRDGLADDRRGLVSVGFGIVGSGLMAGVYANALSDDTRNTRFVGVAVGSRAPALAAKYGVEHIESFEEMLARPDIEAVVLATPHSAHLPETLAAAAAGKHIFLEKPMALNKAECRTMIEAARSAGVVLTVGQVTRRMEAPRIAKQMVDAGEIGDVRMIQVWRGIDGGLARSLGEGSWALDPREGGPFLDWGSHGCDVVRWYAGGEPTLAFGVSKGFDPETPLDETTMAQFVFDNGVFAHIWMTYELPHAVLGTRARYLLVGSKGILDLHAYGQLRRSTGPEGGRSEATWGVPTTPTVSGAAKALATPAGWQTVYQSDDWVDPDAGWGYPSAYMRQGFARQVQDFTDAIIQGRSPEVTGEDGLRAVEMVTAVQRSAATGQAVRLPLE